ncbi:LacI family DNA-binding transcriptional regulator [Clostridium tarantellae]|uniref:Substrate-binding domain-containing protein n=1 Tax=Clostridium tarantellae TaxID=39493 RepID=A0A6I1MN99_9CLOT|nr:LacI family DNA-binding transcriptional regulator [Clostridium tarantellae]MPQ43948.1 substrate-binding domain-containing protein [Clostridium tarantellae]
MRKITLLDVAKEVNLSKTTVSMVLNNKQINVSDATRKRIFEAAKRLNYIPNSVARSLSTKKSYTIGFIIPDIENPFFSEMAKAIETEAEKHGYSIILCNTFNSGKKEEEYIKLLISKLVDGVILVCGEENNEGMKILEKNKVPFVIVDRRVSSNEIFNEVFCDNKYGIKLGIEYLINKGFKKIAFVGEKKNERFLNSRLEYFKELSKEYNIFNEHLIEKDYFSMEGGIAATERLVHKNLHIEAIFYSSDVMAIGGMKYLLKNGYKIPDDMSILGYDNIGICSFIEPELTTIAQPIYKMGADACSLLINIINDISAEGTIIKLPSYLVERETVK